MIKVLTVFGTRPEAVKMAPLIKELEKEPQIKSVVAVTAQHREMLDTVLEIFNIKPDYDLDIMQKNQSLMDVTLRAFEGLYKVINESKPDIVLVHGDTTTTFAGSLASFYNKVKVGHVEAGLRTYNKFFPYPEEMNRKLTTALADFFFVPTELNRQNLIKENITDNVFVTGNTVIDALKTTIKLDYKFKNDLLNKIDFKGKRQILLTAHRRENLGEPLEDICRAVLEISKRYDDVEFIYPVHLNPKVYEPVHKLLGNNHKIHLLEPLLIEDMHNTMSRCYLVLTDSGGLQEEAPALGKPVLVLRNETERPEGIEAGVVKLAGTDFSDIIEFTKILIEEKGEYDKMAKAVNPYGDGLASKRIANAILYGFGLSNIFHDI